MWAYSAYKAIQGGQLRQGGLAVLHNSTCDIHYLKLGYQSVISVLNMAGLHTKHPPIRFLKLCDTLCEMAIFTCSTIDAYSAPPRIPTCYPGRYRVHRVTYLGRYV